MTRDYTALFLFCGLGGGALGFTTAAARLFGHDARFRSIGGIDNDPGACEDFEYLTKSPARCADLATMTPGALREFAGEIAPDAVFDSAPCKADSGLTNRELAKSQKYVDMAQLYVTGVELLLSTWDVPPRLIIKENVPRILSNGAGRIEQVTKMLEDADYAVHISTHDCGELGGLAQHRRRALLVARLKSKVPSLLYQPPRRRVRACGEVLGELPMPETPSAGPMHRMPRIGWLTWLRLAMIPPGGDHRDLPGVLAEHQARRAVWARQHVEAWTEPSVTVTSDGSNGSCNVADPRVDIETAYAGNSHVIAGWDDATRTITGLTGPHGTSSSPHVADPRIAVSTTYANSHAVEGFDDPARTVTATGSRPIAGGASVADPRATSWHPGAFGVKGMNEAAGTITGHGHPSGGPFSVVDPRVDQDGRFKGANGVRDWELPAATITQGGPSGGRFSVGDPRVLPQAENPNAHRNKHKVTGWDGAAGTVAGATRPGSGGPSVADPRSATYYRGALGVVRWDEPTGVITSAGNPAKGRFTVADVRVSRSATRNGNDHCYYVLPWSEPSFTIAGKVHVGTGAYSVADGRDRAFGVIPLEAAMSTINAEGCVPPGPWAIVDDEGQPLASIDGAKQSPFVVMANGKRTKVPIVILAADGTWHRPMTPLELARLQDLPAVVDGEPLRLSGDNVGAWVERIGNCVPVGTAREIAVQMLTTLLASDYGAGLAPTGGVVWVDKDLEVARAAGLAS